MLDKDMYLFGFTGLIIWIIISLIKKVKFNKVLFFSCCIVYLACIAGLTLFPMPIDGSGMAVPHNLVPFRTIAGTLSNGFTPTAFIQIVGNIIISVPYGIAIEFLVRRKTKNRKIFFAILFPLIVETSQYSFGLICGVIYRSFDIDDFFLNALGVFCGYIVFAILPKSIKSFFDFYSYE